MTILPLVLSPDPILKMKSELVEKIDKELQSFLDDMLETMYHEEGAGLAAVQVGVLKRIFVLDMGTKEDPKLRDPHFFINPEIVYCSEEEESSNEGCLSFPGARAMISRPEVVRIKYLDYDGNQQEMEAEGYMARGFLHENDHLDGITMPNRMSGMKKDLFLRRVNKYMREHQEDNN
jgi:peptide deformylase